MTNTDAKIMREAGMGDWIPWAGGECPVDPDTLVHYRLGDGLEDLGPAGASSGCFAGSLRWYHSGDRELDIIAYRVANP